MIRTQLLFIVSTCLSSVLSFIDSSNNGFGYNQLVNPTESYVGPSSYEAPQHSNTHDYPAFGNFGYLMNLKEPQISSSFSSYGPSDGSDFSSTSYINYPSTTQTVQEPAKSSPISSSYSAVISHDSLPPQTNLNSFFDSSSQQIPPEFKSIFESMSAQLQQYQNNQNSAVNSASNQEVPISQHIEVTRPVVVPVYKKFPYPVSKNFPVAIPHPVLVPVPAPYPVNVLVAEPVAVPVIKEIKVPVEREVMYPVDKNVPVEVEKPVQFYVEKHYPVYVNRPYPVKIPIVKTVIHKSPQKWSREEEEADAVERIGKFNKKFKSLKYKMYNKKSLTHNKSLSKMKVN